MCFRWKLFFSATRLSLSFLTPSTPTPLYTDAHTEKSTKADGNWRIGNIRIFPYQLVLVDNLTFLPLPKIIPDNIPLIYTYTIDYFALIFVIGLIKLQFIDRVIRRREVREKRSEREEKMKFSFRFLLWYENLWASVWPWL